MTLHRIALDEDKGRAFDPRGQRGELRLQGQFPLPHPRESAIDRLLTLDSDFLEMLRHERGRREAENARFEIPSHPGLSEEPLNSG